MHAMFQLTCVAFARSTGGRVRLLLAIDRDGEQLFDGEPALLVEHRPGAHHDRLQLEGPDQLSAETVELVRESTALELAMLVDAAFDDDGSFAGARILGSAVAVELPCDCMDA